MAYIPPHLRKSEENNSNDIPINKPNFKKGYYKTYNNSNINYPSQTQTPQPSKSPSTYYSTPLTFSKHQNSKLNKDRWYNYNDSRNDPQRNEKRKKWLEETKNERENLQKISEQYENLKIDISGKQIPNEKIETFFDIDFGEELDKNILKAGYCNPLPVQKATIPIILKKRDLMSCAQTGSGKTAAFLFPIISNILQNPPIPKSQFQDVLIIMAHFNIQKS